MIHEPKNLTDDQKVRICEAQKYKNKGGSISCGHTFWQHAKDKPSGDLFLCTGCYQYFVKMNGLPWWIEGGVETRYSQGKEYNVTNKIRSAHMIDNEDRKGTWYHPIDFRLQDQHGNTICN